jgi:hypothetical protein
MSELNYTLTFERLEILSHSDESQHFSGDLVAELADAHISTTNKLTDAINANTEQSHEIAALRAEIERLIMENEIKGFELRRFSDFISALLEIKNAGCDFRLESDTDGKGDHIFTMTIIEQNNNAAGTGWSIKHQSTQDNIFDAVYLARAALEAKNG